MKCSTHSFAHRTRNRRRRGWLHMSAATERTGAALLNQQCWLWGYDIRRPEGNTLLAYGFSRQRPPEEHKGSNAYVYAPSAERTIVLWSFGMFYGDPARGGIYLGRYGFAPVVLPAFADAVLPWLPGQLPAAVVPRHPAEQRRARGLLREALQWIGEYEAWVRDTAGLAYRQRSVAAWRLGRIRIPAERVPGAWRQLAQRCIVSGPKRPTARPRRVPTPMPDALF